MNISQALRANEANEKKLSDILTLQILSFLLGLVNHLAVAPALMKFKENYLFHFVDLYLCFFLDSVVLPLIVSNL